MNDHRELRTALELLTRELITRVMATDWDIPEEVQQSDRIMRVLSSIGRNIEKCIAMTDQECPRENTAEEEAETQRLREELYNQLVRYADQLGEEELGRRLELDRAEAGSERVVILGPGESVPPAD